MKILGIDYGEKRIGLAISDESQTFARELNILSPNEFWKSIKDLVNQNEISSIVIGWPLNMKGEMTKKTKEVEDFKERLQNEVGIIIEVSDERLTSVMAGSLLGKNEGLDSLAAQILLQNWLDKKKHINLSK